MLRGESYEIVVGCLIVVAGASVFFKAPRAAAGHAHPAEDRSYLLFGVLAVMLAAIGFYFANPNNSPYDYTFRMAKALLRGQLGLDYAPHTGLNEFFALNGWYYTAFPLGSVLVMIPAALATKVFPSKIIVGVLGACQSAAAFLIARAYRARPFDCLAYAIFLALGTWHLCNLAFGGAWQVAIGFSVTAMLWAVYFTLVNPRPFWAGLFFAVAFGNRTEVLLAAPFFYYCFWRPQIWRVNFKDFSAVPLVLGALTLLYNYKRFGTPLEFGYSRIPGVLEEPWYKGGIFNTNSIVLNLRQMLLVGWKFVDGFPYLTPTGFGGSIVLASPFLLTVLRKGVKYPFVVFWSWGLVFVLTSVLWLHGNPGGWQYSYRYAGILLPWLFLLIMEKSPPVLGAFEKVLIPLSVTITAYATYLFYWTNYVRP